MRRVQKQKDKGGKKGQEEIDVERKGQWWERDMALEGTLPTL